MRTIGLIISLCVQVAIADEIGDLLLATQQASQQQQQAAQDFINSIEQQLLPIANNISAAQQASTSSCSYQLNDQQMVAPPRAAKYLVFVSLSMPKQSLQELYQQAAVGGGVLLLRGLKDNSFKQTAAYIQQLAIKVDIDPPAFRQYAITKVPTFVLTGNNQHQVAGNISFNYAKQLLEAAN